MWLTGSEIQSLSALTQSC